MARGRLDPNVCAKLFHMYGKNWRIEFAKLTKDWCKTTVMINPKSANKNYQPPKEFSDAEMIKQMLIDGASTKEIIFECNTTPENVTYHRGVLRRRGLIE